MTDFLHQLIHHFADFTARMSSRAFWHWLGFATFLNFMLTMTVLLVALALGASEDLLARLSFLPSACLLLPTLAAGVRRNRDRALNRQERHSPI